MKSRMRIRLWLGLSLIIMVLAGGCAANPANATVSFHHQFEALVRPYTFNYAAWEFKTLFHELSQTGKTNEKTGDSEAAIMVRFFSVSPDKQDQALKDQVENILARQISQVLADKGIYNPFVRLHFTFPPVNFKLEKPPYVLIVSPREKIERLRDVTLKPDISLDQMEKLETRVDQLNVSALVIPIGGLGATYPSFVMENSDLKYTIDTVAEEWLHQYLAFKPLGFRYVLDLLRIKPDADIDSINETVAGIASQEIGDLVYARYYTQYPQEQHKPSDPPAFDFNAAMRETRLAVDTYLASGQVQQAESYMEARRRFINSHGYDIRKLNQAYFAFYGSYTYSPTSVDPLGDQVRTLRSRYSSLKDFLEIASGLTSRQELRDILKIEV
jgi:hypothetical protein